MSMLFTVLAFFLAILYFFILVFTLLHYVYYVYDVYNK